MRKHRDWPLEAKRPSFGYRRVTRAGRTGACRYRKDRDRTAGDSIFYEISGAGRAVLKDMTGDEKQ